MLKLSKTYFQDIHYLRIDCPFFLRGVLELGSFFYKCAINIKNNLYEKNILKEASTPAYVICVGNLTTGGVGKTPIVLSLADDLSKDEPIAVISRGYKSKLNNKKVNIIKDFDGLKFKDGSKCGDEPFQLAKKCSDNTVVITSKNRIKAINYVYKNYGIKKVILDDGFSNRTVKKDKTIIVIDSKMRFGNGSLLPKGPLREPIAELKRADEIYLVNKGDENISQALDWVKGFNKKVTLCSMEPKKIYNILSKAEVKIIERQKAVAFCAIGQPNQFYNFLNNYYEVMAQKSYPDHYSYTKNDIKKLTELAQKNGTNILITTQKDEAKIKELTKSYTDYNFNVLELHNTLVEID